MLKRDQIRTVWESYQGSREGATQFVASFREAIGLDGRTFGKLNESDTFSVNGKVYNCLDYRQVSLRSLYEAMVGPIESASDVLMMHEAIVTPDLALNISAFGAAGSGLLERNILEGYQQAADITEDIATMKDSRQRFMRAIGIGNLGDIGEVVNPGDPSPMYGLEEEYVDTPETQETKAGVEVDRNAIFFDMTDQLADRARDIGTGLGINRMKRVLRTVMGLDNTYSRNGVSSNTYLTSGDYVNSSTNNPLVDRTALDTVEHLFADLTDPVTGEPIVVSGRTLLVPSALATVANDITRAREQETRTNSGNEIRKGAPRAGEWSVVSSPYVQSVLRSSGLSTSVSNSTWFAGDLKRAFGYARNWDITTTSATTMDSNAVSRGVVVATYASERGRPYVADPRQVYKNVGS